MAQATVKDLADQLTEMSDKFVASFTETMKVEDDLTAFLRGRQRWYCLLYTSPSPRDS